MKRLLSVFVLLALLGQGCSKHHSTPGSGPGNVYVTGADSINPVLWTNGQAQELDNNGGFGARVVVAGNDVYVAGMSDENAYAMLQGPELIAKFTYWKNGVETVDGSAGVLSGPITIAVQGNSIYYIDRELFQDWAVVPLQGMGSKGFVFAAQTSGNAVYLGGCDSIGDAVYWKNGVLHVIAPTPSPGTFVEVSCLYVAPNGDVYAGGTDAQQRAAIWKNGVETAVQSSGGALPLTNVGGIFVSDTDVYSVSTLWLAGGTYVPAYWKNGVQVLLPLNGASYGIANSIFVAGDDVYVAGTTSQGAVLWKNGVETVLAAGGQANSVVVQ